MSALIADEMAVYTKTVDLRVDAQFLVYSLFGDEDVLTRLIERAELVDQPLCSAARCWTPHDLTYQSCCGLWVCDNDQPEHDRSCTEFAAQLREDTL